MRLWHIIALWALVLLFSWLIGAPLMFWALGATYTFAYLHGRLQAFNPRRD